MKQTILRIVFLTIFFAQTLSVALADTTPTQLPKRSAAVMGIHTIQKLDELTATLGEPTSIYRGPNIGIPGLFPAPFAPFGDPVIYTYKGANFIAAKYYNRSTRQFSANHYVYGVDIFEKGVPTERGLSVGDSEWKLVRLYGEPQKKEAHPNSSSLTGNTISPFDTIYYYLVEADGGTARMTVYLYNRIITVITVTF